MNDDARRDLQRHALVNVRGLVDQLEAHDRNDRRTQRLMVVAILAGAAFILAAVVLGGAHVAKSRADGNGVQDAQRQPGQVMREAPRAPQ